MDPNPVIPQSKSIGAEVRVGENDFASGLRRVKKEKGLTNGQLAAHFGVTAETIGIWIREVSEPRADRRQWLEGRLAKLLATPAPEREPERGMPIGADPELVEDLLKSHPKAASAPPPAAEPDLPPPAPEPPKPLVRPLTPNDRRWEI